MIQKRKRKELYDMFKLGTSSETSGNIGSCILFNIGLHIRRCS